MKVVIKTTTYLNQRTSVSYYLMKRRFFYWFAVKNSNSILKENVLKLCTSIFNKESSKKSKKNKHVIKEYK